MIKKNTRFELLKARINKEIKQHEEDRHRNDISETPISAIANTINGMIMEDRTILYLIDEIESMPIKKVREELKGMGGNKKEKSNDNQKIK